MAERGLSGSRDVSTNRRTFIQPRDDISNCTVKYTRRLSGRERKYGQSDCETHSSFIKGNAPTGWYRVSTVEKHVFFIYLLRFTLCQKRAMDFQKELVKYFAYVLTMLPHQSPFTFSQHWQAAIDYFTISEFIFSRMEAYDSWNSSHFSPSLSASFRPAVYVNHLLLSNLSPNFFLTFPFCASIMLFSGTLPSEIGDSLRESVPRSAPDTARNAGKFTQSH